MRENADQNNSEYGHFWRSVDADWNGKHNYWHCTENEVFH